MADKVKIYTKTGDKGETGYIGGRVSKSSLLINCVGEIDELNSCLGVTVAQTSDEELRTKLQRVQTQLFNLGAIVADKENKMQFNYPVSTWIKQLENEIDETESSLPVLTNFILPGGDIVAAYLHNSRSVCRRAERSCVAYAAEHNDALTEVTQYLNRLSDWLFVMARYVNKQVGREEVLWNKDV